MQDLGYFKADTSAGSAAWYYCCCCCCGCCCRCRPLFVVRCSLSVVHCLLFLDVSCLFLSLWIVVAAALTAAGVSFFRALKASPNKSWFWVRVRTRFLQQFEVSRSKHHGSCHAIGYLHHFFDYQCAARSLFGPILGTPRSMYSQRHSHRGSLPLSSGGVGAYCTQYKHT